MLRIDALPFMLRFKRPATTSRGVFETRQVVFLRAESDGVVGWGECGIMPGLSRDDRPNYSTLIADVCEQINAGADPATVDLSELPSVAFGLETALRDLDNGGRQQLFDTPFSRGKAILPTHGLIWMDSPAGMAAQIEQKIALGCTAIKLKIGNLAFDEEMGMLVAFRDRHSSTSLELRLDANGAWGAVDEALEKLERLAAFEPAFLEQPLRAGRWQELAEVCARSPVPIALGCKVIKLKIGSLAFDEEMGMLVAFRRQHPAAIVELRLDANGAWRSVDEALERLEQLAEIDPLFVEQPLPAGRWQEMAALCAASPVPIALDEELIAASTADRRATLLRTIRPQHVILKPSLLGGLAACETWIAEAQQLGVQWWINSLLESNVGLNAIAQWTSARDVERIHGLGTGQLFVNNVPSPLRLSGCGLLVVEAVRWDFSTIWHTTAQKE